MTILTANSPEWAGMADLTVPNKKRYADRWGYGFKHVVMPHRNGFCRSKLWKQELNEMEDGEVMWFLGCDTLIMNQSIAWQRIANLVAPAPDVVIGLDALGINSDSFFIKKNKYTLTWLDFVNSQEGKLPNEQEAMWLGIGGLMVDCVIRPQRQFNSYLTQLYLPQPERGGRYQRGDNVLHLPALAYESRIQLIKHYLKEVIE